jgi:cysteinyl-tRNA synthetase
MTIKIFNTISKKKEVFTPVIKNSVTMYVCGPTVYSHPHIGNARAAIIPDILFRVLKKKFKEVTYIRNITDVDDKISEAAFSQGKTVYQISEKFIKIYKSNMNSLGILNPTYEPKVTDNIPTIIEIISRIIDNGYGYITENHVLFDTNKYKKYGDLSKRSLDEMIDGARVNVASYKKSPRDFVLWKPSDDKQPGWESPWGFGRPGWHIECTSMIKSIIGMNSTLDIHGGGNDLIFPHHENEIAQGNCASDASYCNYWFHNGIVLVNKKKMSKSLGNVILISDLLKKESAASIRLALLSAHYRQPLNWSDSTIVESNNLIKKFRNIVQLYENISETNYPNNEIYDILSDDINTPEAIKYLSLLSKHAKKNKADSESFIAAYKFLGLDILDEKNASLQPDLNVELIENLIKERNEARNMGRFDKADKIRDKLLKMNIELKDMQGKTTWKHNTS